MAQELNTHLKRIGTLKLNPNAAQFGSCWMLGCETLDRDFADFKKYKDYLPALGIPLIRLQSGWAKTEKSKGVYDFSWLDSIVNDAMELGLKCLLETDYGNPIYEGGGGWDLAGGFPTSEEALAAWDAWVENLVLHFRDRVDEWAMWNEPDISKENSMDAIVDFNIRTATIVRRLQPNAKIAGLSLARSDASYFEQCIFKLKEKGGDNLFDSYIYHGYRYNPDDASDMGLLLKGVLKKHSIRGALRQGENGCPSEETQKFALRNYPWSEISQSKWDLRRFIGDYCTGVNTSVFTACDFNHIGRQINRKGLLMADENHNVLRPKMVYEAIQNMTTLFNDLLKPVAGAGTIRYENKTQFFTFKHPNGNMAVYWDRSATPTDELTTGKADILMRTFPIVNPVLIDVLSGAIYQIPQAAVHTCGELTIFADIPCADSPFVLADKNVIEIR
ncbi:MAG: beta-galactosidase [Victivallales bacterium]|nr:beta-galactosidase [Victivallales bacterium]